MTRVLNPENISFETMDVDSFVGEGAENIDAYKERTRANGERTNKIVAAEKAETEPTEEKREVGPHGGEMYGRFEATKFVVPEDEEKREAAEEGRRKRKLLISLMTGAEAMEQEDFWVGPKDVKTLREKTNKIAETSMDDFTKEVEGILDRVEDGVEREEYWKTARELWKNCREDKRQADIRAKKAEAKPVEETKTEETKAEVAETEAPATNAETKKAIERPKAETDFMAIFKEMKRRAKEKMKKDREVDRVVAEVKVMARMTPEELEMFKTPKRAEVTKTRTERRKERELDEIIDEVKAMTEEETTPQEEPEVKRTRAEIQAEKRRNEELRAQREALRAARREPEVAPALKTTEKTEVKLVEKPVEKVAEKAIEKSAEKPAEKPAIKSAEKPMTEEQKREWAIMKLIPKEMKKLELFRWGNKQEKVDAEKLLEGLEPVGVAKSILSSGREIFFGVSKPFKISEKYSDGTKDENGNLTPPKEGREKAANVIYYFEPVDGKPKLKAAMVAKEEGGEYQLVGAVDRRRWNKGETGEWRLDWQKMRGGLPYLGRLPARGNMKQVLEEILAKGEFAKVEKPDEVFGAVARTATR